MNEWERIGGKEKVEYERGRWKVERNFILGL